MTHAKTPLLCWIQEHAPLCCKNIWPETQVAELFWDKSNREGSFWFIHISLGQQLKDSLETPICSPQYSWGGSDGGWISWVALYMHRKRQPFMRINSSAERSCLVNIGVRLCCCKTQRALTPKGVKEFILNSMCVTMAREHGFELPCRRCSAVEDVTWFL